MFLTNNNLFFLSKNYVSTSLVGPLMQNIVKNTKDDLKKQREMHKVVNYTFIDVILFRLINSKGLQKSLQTRHKDPTEPKLIKRDKGQEISSGHSLLVIWMFP